MLCLDASQSFLDLALFFLGMYFRANVTNVILLRSFFLRYSSILLANCPAVWPTEVQLPPLHVRLYTTLNLSSCATEILREDKHVSNFLVVNLFVTRTFAAPFQLKVGIDYSILHCQKEGETRNSLPIIIISLLWCRNIAFARKYIPTEKKARLLNTASYSFNHLYQCQFNFWCINIWSTKSLQFKAIGQTAQLT